MPSVDKERTTWLDYLWSLGGALLGLIVMPVAIAQYPDVFNRNTWILPLSVAVVSVCFALPFLLRDRPRKAYTRITSVSYIGRPLFVVICIVLIGAVSWGARRLVRFHREHLASSTAKAVSALPVAPIGRRNAPSPPPKAQTSAPTQSRTQVEPASISYPYNLAGERRTQFVHLLQPPTVANTIRVGCISWSERACVAAGQFLLLFSAAGWKIDGDRVFRLEPMIPNEGVFIVAQPEPGPPLPPHLGRWRKGNDSEIRMFLAFSTIGLIPHLSSDPSLAKGVTGIYFGPEPIVLSVDERLVSSTHISQFISEGYAVEQQLSATSDAQAKGRAEIEWAAKVERWLRTTPYKGAVRKFDKARGFEEKRKYLTSLLVQVSQQGHP